MTAPKKPEARTSRPKKVEAVDVPPFELTHEELHLILMCRATREDKLQALIVVSESFARNFPRHTRPALRIVSGGAS